MMSANPELGPTLCHCGAEIVGNRCPHEFGKVSDSERLDWLEARANEPGGLLLHDGSESGHCGLGLRPGYLVRSLREAIDTAMGVKRNG